MLTKHKIPISKNFNYIYRALKKISNYESVDVKANLRIILQFFNVLMDLPKNFFNFNEVKVKYVKISNFFIPLKYFLNVGDFNTQIVMEFGVQTFHCYNTYIKSNSISILEVVKFIWFIGLKI